MSYFDLHTHQQPVHAEDRAIINQIVGRERQLLDNDRGYCSCGIHPWYIDCVEDQLRELRELALRPACVAIGEAGFDTYATATMEEQQQVFVAQVRLSEELRKPLIIHCVKAWAALIACRKSLKPQMPWVIHGFRGNAELAAQLIRLGFYLSFGARFNTLALRVAWPDRLFVESDDQAIDIRCVYQNIAEALGVPMEKLCGQIGKNLSILHLGE